MKKIGRTRTGTFTTALLLLSLTIGAFAETMPPLELTETILKISAVAADLSALAYENATQYATTDDAFEVPGYDSINFYTEEPDQAIVAKQDGRCYIAFRGTNANFADWSQNINLGSVNIYKDNNSTGGDFCEARKGFADFVATQVVANGTADALACVAECADPTDCLVITGHSQGGATATIASILLYSNLPTVVTFGQPPAVDGGCPYIPSNRTFRYVNSVQEQNEEADAGFDPVPLSPTFVSKSRHYGYYIMLGPTTSGVKYLGIDNDYTFSVNLFTDLEIDAHSMSDVPYSYQARIDGLLSNNNNNNQTFPVHTNGFPDGTFCDTGYPALCDSGRCSSEINDCVPKIKELCIKGSCEQDSDCESDVCIWDACANASGKVEPGCPCRVNRQCLSGDCDTSFVSLDWVCTNTTSSAAGGRMGWKISFVLVAANVALVLFGGF